MSKSSFVTPIVIPLLTLLTGCVFLPVGRSPYVSAEGNLTYHVVKNTDLNPAEDTAFEGDVDDGKLGGLIAVGYPVLPFADVEVGYLKLGDVDFDGRYTFMGTQSTDVGTISGWGIRAGAVGRLPVPGRFTPLAKLGIVRWKLSEDEVFAGVPESHEASGIDPYFGLGVEVDLPSVLAFRVGWDYYTGIGDEDETGRGSANQVSAGLVARLK
ncbi:MAG: outer membrane beta-barrel protein [Rhodothermales bacterium]|nr:outer membrane beta-barrel protein [Rhodothermales bacterium]